MSQTTLARRLSKLLGIPQISLDELFWQPNWTETPIDEFKTKLSRALKEAEEHQNPPSTPSNAASDDSQDTSVGRYTGWVVDGNYFRRGGLLVTEQATDVIWLDPPFVLSFWRVFLRTVKRLFGYGKPCSPGCEEDFRLVFFSKDSIFLDCIQQVSVMKAWSNALMKRIGITAINDEDSEADQNVVDQVQGISGTRRMRRIGGWGGELSKWMKSVQEMVTLDRKTA
ncbi:hypothetical protein AX16_007473 [Volvariella volvacea WC 439]|nr:hypothetical protein AX16_007473 [Volvariella volvacea WC 439]